MQTNIRKKADTFHKQGTKRRLWQRIVSGLTCIVVFCTTYALILPAITLEGDAFCGVAEHTHAESCYNGTVMLTCSPAHVHSSECYGADAGLICGQSDYVVHSHDTICYDADGALLCALPEIAAHVHGDSCYTQVMPEGHVHEELCYTTEQGALVCSLEESEGHGHGDGCYGEQVLICQIAESAGHAHAAECYSEPVLSCGQEETEGHAHDTTICYGEDGSLICQLPEAAAHGHGETCYTQELLCGQEVSEGHTHGEGCYEIPLVCTVPESEGHVHSDGCYEWNKTLVCGQEEVQPQSVLTCTVANETVHVHTETCLTQPELVCVQEEHIHTLECYSDANADVETEEFWRSTMADADLSGSDAQDLVSIAQTQLGYSESARNYAVLADGITIKGYTRYGAWAGTPYADWNELFVQFCLYYAGIEKADLPWSTGGASWIQTLSEAGLYYNKEAGTPDSGDLIFLNLENKTYAGIVTRVSEGYVTVTLGDYKNEVRSETFTLSDGDILGYASLRTEVPQQAPEAPATETEAAVIETTTAMETTSETTQPVTETTESTEVTGTTETTVETTAETTETTEATEETAEVTEELEEIEMVYATLMTLARGGTTDTVPTNLNAATNVQISAIYGAATMSEGAVYDPETDTFDVSLRFDFTLTKDAIIAANYLYTYDLPDNIIVPDELLNRERIGKDGTQDAFIYQFVKYQDENGEDRYRVDIHYLDTYVNNSGETIDSYIEFNGKVSGDSLEDGTGDLIIDEGIEIPSEDIVYPENETHTDSIKTEKSASDYDMYGHTIDYTVKVSSEKGTSNPIQFSDQITSSNINLGNITNVEIVKYKTDGATETVNVTPMISNTDKTVNMELPALNDGEFYEITYTCEAQQTGQNQWDTAYINNEATATTTSSGGITLESSDSTSTEISQNPLGKTGTYNAETGKIDWTIKVKPSVYGNGGLYGYELSDPAFKDMTVEELRAAITPTGGFEITVDSDGNKKITFTDTHGYNWYGYYYSANYNTYTIQYSTDALQTTLPGEQTNTVELEYQNSGYPYTDEETVYIPAGGSIDKSFVSAADGIINWQITVDIPQGGLASGTVIKDNSDDTMSMTYEQLAALKSQLDTILGTGNYDLQARCMQDWSIVEFSTIPTDTVNTFDEIQITVNKDYAQSEFTDGKITLNYSHTITNLNDGWVYKNTASMGDKSDSDSYTYHPHVTKTDKNGYSDSTFTSTDGKIYWQVKVYVEKDTDEITVVDTLPTGVTLSKIGYSYEGWRAEYAAKPLEQADTTVTIMYKELGVSNQRIESAENGTETITTTFMAPTGEKILEGSLIYLHYECTIDDLVDGTEQQFQNGVKVWDNDVYYGSDDDTQTVKVDLPDQIVKVDGGGNTGTTTNVDISSGKIYWFVKLYLHEETDQITVLDQLPKGLTLTKHGLSQWRQNGGNLSINGTTEGVQVYDQNYTVVTAVTSETDAAGERISTTITAQGDQSLPVRQEFYLGYECTIDENYVFAEDGSFSFTNTATLNPDDPDHPDPVTQTQEGTKEEETTTLEAEKLGLATDQWGNKYLDKNEMTYQDDNGIVRWMIKIPVNANMTTIDVIDRLPVGVKLVRFGVSNTSEGNFGDTIVNGTVEVSGTSGSAVYWNYLTATYSISGDGTQNSPYVVTTQVTKPNYWQGEYVFLYYECQVDPMPPLGQTIEFHLTNTAEVKVDGTVMNTPSHTQHVTVSNPAARVTKNGVMNAEGALENRFYYDILINEGGEDLIKTEGAPLVIEDLMKFTYNAYNLSQKITSSLVRDSVKLYHAVLQEDGTFAKGEELESYEWSWTFETNQNEMHDDGWGEVENKLTITLPDETPVFLEYAYDINLLLTEEEIKQYDGTSLDLGISNSASFTDGIEGSDSFNDTVSFKVSSAAAGASTAKSYTINKVNEANHGEALAGAEFMVYKAEDNTQVKLYTTSSFGSFTISFDNSIYQTNTLYYVTETMAPDGYVKPVDPPKYYFYFGGESGVAPTIPDGVTAYDLTKVGHAVDVGNQKLPSGDIMVEKKWYNGTGENEINGYETVTSISFDLYRMTSTAAPSEGDGSGDLVATAPTGGTLYEADLTVTQADGWTTTIRDLPSQAYDENGDLVYYTYYIVEDGSADFELMGYTNNSGIQEGTITISNKEKTPVYELPETGGTGTMMYTLGGLAMCGWACLQYNHKKRRKEDQTS